jgi:hypothetical protein
VFARGRLPNGVELVANALLMFVWIVLSLPVNLIKAVAVLYSASIVIFPLIWSELSN